MPLAIGPATFAHPNPPYLAVLPPSGYNPRAMPHPLPAMPHLRALAALAVVLGALTSTARGAEPEPISYSRQVQPILAKHCFACHGPDDAESGLALDASETALALADSGFAAIVPGKSHESELIARVTAEDEGLRMPPEGKPLAAAEIAILKRWIDEGAKWEKHWAFDPIREQTPPEVKNEQWVAGDIDRFILSGLERKGLTPAPPADKATLARRLYYDLIGLPPTQDELADFLADQRADAYERLVDKLLASPHYGERWGRQWLDVVRYAESNSFERDGAKPNAWKYRDYVIRSLNDDKPYDRFIREQLAGDELDEANLETMTATGYYRLGIWDDEPADMEQALADEMDDIVSTTAQAFLGLTIGCARCHDHKIDPIPQKDYFGIVAMMADVTTYGVRNDQTSNNQWDNDHPERRALRNHWRREVRRLNRQITALEQEAIRKLPDTLQRATETEDRAEVLAEHLDSQFSDSERTTYNELKQELTAAEREMGKYAPQQTVLALAKTKRNPPAVQLHERGNPHVLGDVVEPHFPELFDTPVPQFQSTEKSPGRRRALANWITSPDNLLTTRVMANRVWQGHFGRGIVRSSNNFGQLGTPPTHPELLDYLATKLVEFEWRLKPLHRLIVLSSTYRMSSAESDQGLALDPANDLFWRFDRRRLSAEEVRDTVLVTTGQLNRAVYGPSIYPTLSNEVLETQSMPGNGWGRSTPEEQARRSVYIFVKRSLLVPTLTAFDFPDPDTSCEARFNTTQPGQAFAMLHSEFMHEQARLLAEQVRAKSPGSLADQIGTTIELALGRDATADDIELGLDLIGKLREQHGQSDEEALRYYCLAVMNFNEFLYID